MKFSAIFILTFAFITMGEVLQRADGSHIKIHDDGTWTKVDSPEGIKKEKSSIPKRAPITIGEEFSDNVVLLTIEGKGENTSFDIEVYGVDECILKDAKVTLYFAGGKKVTMRSTHLYDCERRVRLSFEGESKALLSVLKQKVLRKMRIMTTGGYYDVHLKDEEAKELRKQLHQ